MDDTQEEIKLGNTNTNSFAEVIYNEISSALGTNGKNQFLCLQIPGTILNANDYRYNYSSNASKPLIVEANESRLANKMFNPCKITESDNGLSLPYLYESALNTLTPKLDKRIIELKNQIRQLLLSEYPYDFGDGIETKYTLQQVYFKLYDDYITALNEWSKIQSNKKEELRKKYPIKSDFKEAYIEWHEIEAERYLSKIEEKKTKVLAVFSPNDMKVLEGILDCGTGAELQVARSALKKARKLTPAGDYVYPIHFVPANWFDMIGTSFTSNDLMKSPEDLSLELQNYSLRRIQLCSYIQNNLITLKENKILDNNLIQDLDFILNVQKKISSNERNFFSLILEWIQNNEPEKKISTDILEKVIIPITDIHVITRRYINTKIIEKLTIKEKIRFIIERIDYKQKIQFFKQIIKIATTRKKYIEKMIELTKKIELELNVNNNPKKERLIPVVNQFKDINEKINIILEQIKQGIVFQSSYLESQIQKILIPKGFVPISLKAKKSSNPNDFEFLFFGKKNESNKNENLFKECTISITMNVSKIGIERDWFNPGIFAQTKNMLKLGDMLISPEQDDYNGFDENRFKEMSKCIFPCYPIAMIIARDISITFDFSDSSVVPDAYEHIEKQALSGCGFLMFRNMLGNSTIHQSSSHVFSQNKRIVVRIDSTQLIGYCLEATRADKSISLESISNKLADNEAIREEMSGKEIVCKKKDISSISSISEFAKNYKLLIEQSILNRKKQPN